MEFAAEFVLESLEGESRLRQQHLDGVLTVELCGFQDGEYEVVGLHSFALVLFGEKE